MYRELKEKEKYEFFNLLYAYIKSQTPILNAFDFISKRSSSPYLRRISTFMFNEIATGTSLTQVFEKFRPIFGNIYSTLVISGERTGKLETVLLRILHLLKRKMDLRSKLMSSFAYPAFLLNMMVLVLCLYKFYLMPFMTAALARESINYTDMALNAAGKTLLLFLLIYAFIFFLFKTKNILSRIIIGILSFIVPKFREFIENLYWSEYFLVFSTAYESGASMITTCELADSVVELPRLKKKLSDLRRYISNGSSVTKSFASMNILPPEYISLIAAGEETGALARTMDSIITDIDARTDLWLKMFTKILEPACMLIIGVILGKILASFYTWMFSAIGSAM